MSTKYNAIDSRTKTMSGTQKQARGNTITARLAFAPQLAEERASGQRAPT